MASYIEFCVYFTPLPDGLDPERLPGLRLETHLDVLRIGDTRQRLESTLAHCCRKIITICVASNRAKEAEREFYSTTIRESPALFGEHAVEVVYHLEAFLLIARSSLDLAAVIFSEILFRKRVDSFNELTKALAKSPLKADFQFLLDLREVEFSWFSLLCGSQRGRALRDKVAHQTGFPIDYEELTLGSEKESAVVRFSREVSKPLATFLDDLRADVINNFLAFEDYIENHLEELAS